MQNQKGHLNGTLMVNQVTPFSESDTDGLQACMLGFHLSSSSLGCVVLSIMQELKLKMRNY